MQPRPSRVLLYSSLAAFAISLPLPAYHALHDWPGWSALLLSPLGILAWHFSGYANLLLALSWVLIYARRSPKAMWLALAALLLAGTSLLGKSIPVGSSGEYDYTPLSGYYVWPLSILLAVLASLAQRREGLLLATSSPSPSDDRA